MHGKIRLGIPLAGAILLMGSAYAAVAQSSSGGGSSSAGGASTSGGLGNSAPARGAPTQGNPALRNASAAQPGGSGV